MAPKLPTTVLRRPLLSASSSSSSSSILSSSTTPSYASSSPSSIRQTVQVRNATFVLRHRRPYQFTQLVQLSDGSTFTVRTTSPLALYKSAKDSRNHMLWQPSDKTLRN